MAIVFIAARSSIARAVEGSGIAELVRLPARQPPQGATRAPFAPTPADGAPSAPAPKRPTPGPEAPATPQPARTVVAPEPAPPAATRSNPAETRATPAPAARRPAPAPEPRPTPKRRRSTLYFVTIGDEGTMAFTAIPRTVTYVEDPLTQTLESLVAGPTAGERQRGYRSLIPTGTRIEEVRVEGRTALVSFSESFRFSAYGKEGLVGQLRQVVFTATEFGSVDRVQILIAGRITDYLGQEGVRIRDPLSRQSFADGRL